MIDAVFSSARAANLKAPVELSGIITTVYAMKRALLSANFAPHLKPLVYHSLVGYRHPAHLRGVHVASMWAPPPGVWGETRGEPVGGADVPADAGRNSVLSGAGASAACHCC
eukprot:2408795-Rhodomonas_salina.1